MQIVKKGNVYLIRTPNKTFTYKTLKGAKNKLNRLKEEIVKQKQKQTQRQSVIVNVNTSRSKPSARKTVKAITQPQQPPIRITPSITPFTALEQFSQARPRSNELLPSQIAQEELKLIKNSINELREEHLKLVEAESKRTEDENFRDIFIKPSDNQSIESFDMTRSNKIDVETSDDEEDEEDESDEKSSIDMKIIGVSKKGRGRPSNLEKSFRESIRNDNDRVINNIREENIFSEDIYGGTTEVDDPLSLFERSQENITTED